MLANFNTILSKAYNNGYAIGAFNCYNYETFKGVIDCAKELNQPVIVAFGQKYLKNMSLNTAVGIVKVLAEDLTIPVCLHLDHCSDINIVFKAIKAGFNSVMYDGSALPFEENLKNTRMVCEVAHASGVTVEAELGSLQSGIHSHEGTVHDKEIYTDPISAQRFVKETGVDALAVSIGTVHGMYKGKPNIRVDILKEINTLTGIPLVLHGGSGTPEEDIRKCIKNGISKINVNTEISSYVVEETTKLLQEKQPHYSEVSLKQQELVIEVVRKYLDFFTK